MSSTEHPDLRPFKRLNFFTGFFTTAKDWQEGQQYHLDKRSLHNSGLHTPGVISRRDRLPGDAENLEIQAAGGFKLAVAPGAALDGWGNLIVLDRTCEKTVTLPASLPKTVYIALRYSQACTDFIANVQDPDYSGFTRVTEKPVIEILEDEPDQHEWIELARIDLQPGVTQISNPGDPQSPQANEIDRRFVRWAGAVDAGRDRRLAALHERIIGVHERHQAQQRRHNRALHTPGILRQVGGELQVAAAGGLVVQVQPGAALDAAGNELYLEQAHFLTIAPVASPQLVYIAAVFEDRFAGYLADLAQRDAGAARTARLEVRDVEPDQQTWIELARIALDPNASELREPDSPANPQANELDRRARVWAGARGLAPVRLPAETQRRIHILMETTRENFAELVQRFASPAVDDVRHAGLHLQMGLDVLEPETLTNRLATLAALMQDARRDLARRYEPLVGKAEFTAFQEAIDALSDALRKGQALDIVLNHIQVVAEAARDLARVVFPRPTADAGPDQAHKIYGDEKTVTLDASGSQAAKGQKIRRYRWERES